MDKIRNFSIIAHIDHGKSTLADRLIQKCGGLNRYETTEQILDSMDLERERGITIKSQSVTLFYKSLDNNIYQLNFIDTPGHIDFSYEVSRSLAACEGALLLIDSVKGGQAQTISNYYAAMEMNLKILFAFNKIDLLNANPNKVSQEINNILHVDNLESVQCSAKTGYGIDNLLESLIKIIPSPSGNSTSPLQALIIDSWFDNYLGVVSLVRIKNGILRKGDKIKVMSTKQSYIVDRLGIFTPKRIDRNILNCGEVGWVVCTIKNIHGAPVGDTLTLVNNPSNYALPGFKKIQPKVYASLFPVCSNNYHIFRNSLEKLSLNDASLFYEPEHSIALGLGFRCGFLGLLHMDIIKERLEREYKIDLIITAPTVLYEVLTKDNNILYIDNPLKLPNLKNIVELREPIAECRILSPKIYLGKIITLCIKKRGIQIMMSDHNDYIMFIYNIPMSEIIVDFLDHIKSISNGYASLDYTFKYFQKSEIVQVNILINKKKIDALSFLMHKNNAFYKCRTIVKKLQSLIPRQQFDIDIQASINNHIVARFTVKQLRKNVIAKCYGGDVTRKKKLLYKQKQGKKLMKSLGTIALPQEVFLSILTFNTNNK